jgi:hypothetical protein
MTNQQKSQVTEPLDENSKTELDASILVPHTELSEWTNPVLNNPSRYEKESLRNTMTNFESSLPWQMIQHHLSEEIQTLRRKLEDNPFLQESDLTKARQTKDEIKHYLYVRDKMLDIIRNTL